MQAFIDNCITCILACRKQGKQEGKLSPIPKEATPIHTIHIDHVGPLPSTSKKYKHLLVIVDAFTKYTWIFPTKSTGTAEVIKKLNFLQQHFGNPRRIVSERGTAFTSRDFEEHCKKTDIQYLLITTGIPRGNGQVERVNEIISSVFAKLAIEEPLKWYKYVTRVQHAVNGSHQRSIGTTPFQLMFGAKLFTPDDAQLFQKIGEARREKFLEERGELRSAAMEQIKKVQQENAKQYNKNRNPPRKYKYGDIVAIKSTQQGPGLELLIKYLGPYIVTKVNNHDRYDVEALTVFDGPVHTSTEAQNMKPWRGFRDDLEEDDLDDGAPTDEADNETNNDIEEDEVDEDQRDEEDSEAE